MRKLMIILGLVFFFFIGGSPTESQAQVVVKIRPMRGKVVVKPAARRGQVWIPAHWNYNNKKRKYVWKTGHWSKTRKGQRYVGGHWKKVSGGHKYVPGHWKRK